MEITGLRRQVHTDSPRLTEPISGSIKLRSTRCCGSGNRIRKSTSSGSWFRSGTIPSELLADLGDERILAGRSRLLLGDGGLADRIICPPACAKRARQVEMRLRVDRPQPDRAFEVCQRRTRLAADEQHGAEVILRFRVGRIAFDGALVMAPRFVEPALGELHAPQ